ncbi:MAG: coproporphyrinogen-III oxidase family protein [Kiritimatiellia bacterium]
MAANLYVHFPFCRRKCSYCALYSRAGVPRADRDAYVRRLAAEVGELAAAGPGGAGRAALKTVYFGGGSPALCDLRLLADALRPQLDGGTEFTVELHPLDVTDETLLMLADLGVNRISMGVQSLNDDILADMGRGYAAVDAERAFARIRRRFDNAGIDLIVGYPSPRTGRPFPSGCGELGLSRLKNWGLRHCSVYSLMLEEQTRLWGQYGPDAPQAHRLPSDDETLDTLRAVAAFLSELGLRRYEISNYAVPGFECRHNLAVWRGEDYLGLGDGAFGRLGRLRTSVRNGVRAETEVDALTDRKERTLFRLRTRDGLDATDFPEWGQTLKKFVKAGLLTQENTIYLLTERGTEVCDSILVELV